MRLRSSNGALPAILFYFCRSSSSLSIAPLAFLRFSSPRSSHTNFWLRQPCKICSKKLSSSYPKLQPLKSTPSPLADHALGYDGKADSSSFSSSSSAAAEGRQRIFTSGAKTTPRKTDHSLVSVIMVALSLLFSPMMQSPANAALATEQLPDLSSTNYHHHKQNHNHNHNSNKKLRYWQIQESGTLDEKRAANAALVDFEVGTIHTMYYDPSGGAYFEPRDYALSLRRWLKTNEASDLLKSRPGTVQTLKRAVTQLGDPFSKYLTRDELKQELTQDTGGFLGMGAVVEPNEAVAAGNSHTLFGYTTTANPVLISNNPLTLGTPTPTANSMSLAEGPVSGGSKYGSKDSSNYLSVEDAVTLPVVTAVAPDSPAERDGVTVGDRIVGVVQVPVQPTFASSSSPSSSSTKVTMSNNKGHHHYPYYWLVSSSSSSSSYSLASPFHVDSFLGKSPSYTSKRLEMYHSTNIGNNNKGVSRSSTSNMRELILAKPLLAVAGDRDVVVGYRVMRIPVPTITAAEVANEYSYHGSSASAGNQNHMRGGNAFVHYELLRNSIFHHHSESFTTDSGMTSGIGSNSMLPSTSTTSRMADDNSPAVGYIRLTRFSRASTAEFVKAVEALEQAGATSLIIDLRNNYGGIIQEAMLTASSLLRDPHAVLCYTLNSRGGFTPHDVEEYVVDTRYPGYLFSYEPKDVSLKQVQLESPEIFEEDGIMWVPPSSYQSLHEQNIRRAIHRPGGLRSSTAASSSSSAASWTANSGIGGHGWGSAMDKKILRGEPQYSKKEKSIALLVNEGTASSAEVFASALHDNGRTVALIGTKTYGKGLIQHTFPMPDGGGLRLTIAEYLTPALHHVTLVGGAQFDPRTGERIGGGIKPDIYCESNQGIPGNVGADLCVGMALDALEEADDSLESQQQEQQQLQQRQQQQLSPQGTIRWATTNGITTGGSGLQQYSGHTARRPVSAGIVKDDY